MGIRRFFNPRSIPANLSCGVTGLSIAAIDAAQAIAHTGPTRYALVAASLAGLVTGGALFGLAVQDIFKKKAAVAELRPAGSFGIQAAISTEDVRSLIERRNERLQEAFVASVFCAMSTQLEPASSIILGAATATFALAKLGYAATNTVQIKLQRLKSLEL